MDKPSLDQITVEDIPHEEVPTFKPGSNYQWDPEEVFPVDGKTFDVVFNLLQAKVNTREVQEALMTFEAFKRVEAIFIKAVEAGKIKEAETPPDQQVHTN